MSVIDFNKDEILKTLEKEGLLTEKEREKVRFHDLPEELINEEVQAVLTLDGRKIPEEELKSFAEIVRKISEEQKTK
jgi:hypothetical protein